MNTLLNTKISGQSLDHDLKMPQAFTFDFNSDFDSDGDGDGNGNGVELDGHNFLNESQTDTREVSGMQTNPHSEEPKSHSLPEMV